MVPTSFSSPESKPAERHLQIFTIFLQIVVCVLGVIGNGLVIFVAGCKMKKTVNTVWFLNLAVADFLFTFFLLFGIVQVSRNHEWPFGDFMCKFYNFLFMVNMFSSVFLLTAISLDRCLSTWLVVWAQNKRSLLKARITCFFIWFTSLICSLPYATHRRTEIINGTNVISCSQDISLETYKFQIVFRFILGFLIPLMIITACYVAIGIRVKRLHQKTMKPFKTILVVILAFFICWLPFHIFRFLDLWVHETSMRNPNANLGDFQQILPMLINLVGNLAYFNSCLNPFLYVFMCQEFKTKLRKSLVSVFESAFAEEHLALFSSRYSFSQRQGHSQTVSEKDDTQQSNLSSILTSK